MTDYVQLASDAILQLLDQQHAAVWPEIEARLSEPPPSRSNQHIDPHHLSSARTQLRKTGFIEEITKTTRGNHLVTVLGLANRKRRVTAFEKAAQRKRLLYGRYLAWSNASPTVPSLIGRAGERVTHASLIAVASRPDGGYRVLGSPNADVGSLFGTQVPGGALDNAAHVIVEGPDGPPLALTLLFEVKNIRPWIYPSSAEVYQLLDKASRLQLAYPNHRFVPILVCRRAQYLAFRLAKDLGFLIAYTKVQPILPHSDAPPARVEEVSNELGFNLVQTEAHHSFLVHMLTKTIPEQGVRFATRWSETAESVAQYAGELRKTNLAAYERRQLYRELIEAVSGEVDEYEAVFDN